MSNTAFLSKGQNDKVWLNEISLMRPVLLVLLVSYHAFAPYVGSWDIPDGIDNVELYRWIGLLSRAFRLEGFVFISGYVFTFQLIEQKKYNKLSLLLKSKFERLLIPGFVFSIIYLLVFKKYDTTSDFVLKAIQGAGHLWYLPCLFWCFVFQYLILKIDKPGFVLPILVLALLMSISPLPFNMNKPLYYMLFFYGGGYFWQNSQKIKSYGNGKNIVFSWIIFLLLFLISNMIISHISANYSQTDSLVHRGVCLEAMTILKAVMGWSGIISLYLSACLFCHTHKIGPRIIKVGACGYGVYVFHQFILKYIYYYTDIPALSGTVLLPWLALLITIAISLAMTLLIRQTVIGRRFL